MCLIGKGFPTYLGRLKGPLLAGHSYDTLFYIVTSNSFH